MIFQLDVVHNWPSKLSQKSTDDKLYASIESISSGNFLKTQYEIKSEFKIK